MKNVEDVYRLSPMQRGMLYHALSAREAGAYVEQRHWTWRGELDVAALRRAWRQVVERHAVLRTSFFWENLPEPMQAVRRQVEMPWDAQDWRDVPAEEQARRWEALVEEDRRCGFKLTAAPLLRFTLVTLAPGLYRCLWTYHHLVLDGWSLPLCLREVFLHYEANVRGQALELPPSRPFREYIGWLGKQDAARAEAWWKQALEGFASPTPVGVEAAAGSAGSEGSPERYERQSLRLSAAETARLGAFARAHQLTLGTLAQGAWALLLGRSSGEEDVAFGTVTSGRPPSLPGVETALGLFINTVVVRTKLPPGSGLLPWLKALQGYQLAAQEHGYLTLTDVQRHTAVAAGQRLFHSLVVVENTPERELLSGLAGRLPVEDFSAADSRAGYPLAFVVHVGAELELALVYDAERFDAAPIRRKLEHLRALLEGMVAKPEAPRVSVSLLSGDERQQVLEAWNATAREYPRDATLPEVFAHVVARFPDKVAVEFGDARLTYRELDARANQLAWHLRALGVGTDVRVALAMERSLELIVALVGILKAGGAYIPLDAGYPRERLVAMMEDARPRVLVTTRELLPGLPHEGLRTMVLEDAPLAEQPESAPPPAALPMSLAYIDFTSGSTGRPKGVGTPQAAVLRTVFGNDYAHLGPGETLLLIAPVSFDASTLELWGALLHGAKLVVYPPHAPTDVDELESVLVKHGVTTLHLTAGLFTQVVDTHLGGLCTVRQLLTGGDVVSAPHVRRVLETLRIPVTACYGPTETTLFASCHRMTEVEQVGEVVPIGRPIGNTRVYVLDRYGQPVPAGVVGELFIGGDGVARGYVERPDLTAERFLPDAFSPVPGARLYRTGDLARWREDGVLEFLGRADAQVKVRGYRIELSEVEAALTKHPGVREAVVVAREDTPGTKRLVAYAVPAPSPLPPGERWGEGQPSPSELREHLTRHLPEYMVPSAIVLLPALPLTSNGKVDRKALPAPESIQSPTPEVPETPSTPTEEKLAALWAELLRVKRVGPRDNFFALGGDSILSLQLVARARGAGLHFTPRQLFQHPTVAELAPVVSERDATVAEQGPVVGPVPLTPIQRAFLEEVHSPAPHHFNQAVLLHVRQPLSASELEAALRKVVEHHDALWMRFTREDGRWRQHGTGLEHRPSLRRVDLSTLSAAERAAALAAIAAELHAGFRLDMPPLLSAALFDFGPSEPARLLLVAHHLVVDAVSWRVLLEDLESACLALRRGQTPRLPPKTTSFRTWSERLSQHARSEALAAELRHWEATANTPVPPLPRDRADGSNTAASERTITAALDMEETHLLLREVPPAYRAHLHEVLLAAVAQALRAWTGQDRFRVDVEGHGREDLFADVDLTRTVGWFTSVYPVVLEAPEGASPGDVLRSVRDGLRAVPGQGLGHGLLRHLREDDIGAKLRARPGAEVSFNYLGQLDTSARASTLFALSLEPSGPARSPAAPRTHLLDVAASVRDERLHVGITFSEHLHTEATLQAVADAILDALRGFIAARGSADARRYTPTDFPLAGLTQEALDRVLPPGMAVEDLYPLTSLQQGLLFHTLRAPGSGVYVTQLAWTFAALVDLTAFRRAWETVVERHAVLRTAFLWNGLEAPLQRVHPSVALPWEEHDWSGLSAPEQESHFQALLAEDRARGFDPDVAPLMRLTVVRLGEHMHRVLWTHHHLLLDGWSLGVLFQELFAAHAEAVEGRAPPRETESSFRDYIGWLRRQSPERAEAYWREALRGFHTPTPLPGARLHAEGAAVNKGKAVRALPLGAEATQAMQAFTRQHQLTLNALVQGAWVLVLSRYTGQQDVLFGATGSGRSAELPGIEHAVGLFINTLPVRIRVEDEARALAWLKALHARQLELRQYEHSSLMDLQGWSEVPRGTPLFESLFALENYPLDAAIGSAAQGLGIRDVFVSEQADTPLEAVVIPGTALELRLAYDPSRFESGVPERLLRHWAAALEALVAKPEAPLASVSLLSGDERRQVLEAWNATTREYPRDSTLPEVFAHAVARFPDKVAVEFGDARLTYRQLDARANQLAWHLRSLGVGTDVRVALAVERSLELIVTLVGILKAGGVYVPLDASYPRERLVAMVEDARPRVLVTTRELLPRLPHEGLRTVVLEEAPLNEQPESAPPPGALSRSLAYIDFTSGSTGRPKGVGIEHRGVLRTVLGMDFARFGPEETWLHLSPVTFDASTLEIWGALLHGARLVVFPPRAPSLEELARVVRQAQVTTVFLTAGLLTQVAEHHVEALRPVRQVLTGGDVASAPHVRRVVEGMLIPVTNCYGPTEITVCATAHRMTEAGDLGDTVSIGTTLANTRVYVLDGRGQPVPVGLPGEVYVGGDGLARGYVERPDLTAERFVPDALSGEAGARLYRTGDLARWREDGTLEFQGRADAQVKLRGYRIEPGEVEATLLKHPNVREAVVLVREDIPGHKRLVAYAVPGTPLPPGEGRGEGLHEYLRQHLPEYMVPAAVVLLPALPLTSNGKVDRKALPAPEPQRARASTAAEPPQSPTEKTLAGLWSKVLGVEQPGRHDNFFALGGHSLLAMQLVSRVRTTLGVELPLQTLFAAPTLAELSHRIDTAGPEQALQVEPPLRPVSRTGALPLSFAQQRLWFLDRLEPGSPAYNIPVLVRLEGALDVAALERALAELVRRHESLRTVIRDEEGHPGQVIHAQASLPLDVEDLSTLERAAARAEARSRAADEAVRPFDLTIGPLVRARLWRLGEEEHLLALNLHHIISDGASMEVVMREVAALYGAFSRRLPSPLPELSLQYGDYAVWQREWLRGEVLERQLAWWKQRLSGAAPLELPLDRPRPPSQTFQGAAVPVSLSPELSRRVKVLSQREGVTPFMTLLAAWQSLLSRYTGQEDISVGTPIAGRSREEVEGLIGFFVNTLVLRARVDPRGSFLQVLREVKEVALGAFAHSDVPFEKLVDALQPERDASRTPLFQVFFALQNPSLTKLQAPGLTLRALDVEARTAKFDLELTWVDTEEGYRGELRYNTALFEPATAERMATHLRVLLEGIAENPSQPVRQLPLMDAAQERELRAFTRGREPEYPREQCLHTLIESQVDRTPDAEAVRFEGTALTYAELDARANQLAHHLRARGVTPDARVGVCLERSLELVVALLGVLKAGAAYVPLDPAHPRERLEGMREDATPTVILTQRHLRPKLPECPNGSPLPLGEGQGEGHPPTVCLDTDWEHIAVHPSTRPPPVATPAHLAYVLFTSGSTGRPKGAMNAHAGIVNRLLWMQEEYGLTSADTVLQKTPFSFDVSVWEFFWPLMTGARLVVARPGGHQEPAYLVELMERELITTVHFVPSLLQAFVEEPGLERLKGLRRILCSGEALPGELVRRCHTRLAATEVHNLYGPTESAVDVTYWACPREDLRRVPIGRPVAHTRIHILDAHGQQVPVGVPGELHIGGLQVGRGYLRRPELTAERFIPDVFSREPGTRLYRTGDLARWLRDGTVEYLGRLDFQVKVRGLRIELEEIEVALRAHPAVREAVVVAREDVPGHKRLVAYAVPNTPLPPGEGQGEGRRTEDLTQQLRAHLKQRLPEYMVPAVFVVLEALPLNANGKLDRKALPAPDTRRQEGARDFTAPRTPVEATLAALWAKVLGLSRVGAHDNFFELGGDSLLMLRVVSLAGQAGLTFTVRQMLQHPTVAGLAEVASTEARPEAPQDVTVGPLELTPNQHMSFGTEDPDRNIWNVTGFFETDARLDPGLLAQAVRHLTTHHDALRVRVVHEANGWRQVILPPGDDGAFVHVDLSSVPDTGAREAIEARAAELQRGLDLERGPMLRVALFDLGEGRPSRLLVIVHHTVCDGYSVEVLLQDLASAYLQLAQGEPVRLPPKTTSLQAFARGLVELAATEAVRQEAPYWLEAARREVKPPPVDFPEGQHTGANARVLHAELSREDTQALLRAVSPKDDLYINDLLLAGFARAYARWSGQRTVLVDMEDHGRDVVEGLDLSRTVGWLNYLYPLLLDVGTGGPRETLHAVRQRLRALPRRGLGHGLLRHLGPDASLREALRAMPRPRVLFNYRGNFADRGTDAPLGMRRARESSGLDHSLSVVRQHLLMLSSQVVQDTLSLEWVYSEAVHRRSTVESLVDAYLEALRELSRR